MISYTLEYHILLGLERGQAIINEVESLCRVLSSIQIGALTLEIPSTETLIYRSQILINLAYNAVVLSVAQLVIDGRSSH